jgi:hypothetical protein
VLCVPQRSFRLFVWPSIPTFGAVSFSSMS